MVRRSVNVVRQDGELNVAEKEVGEIGYDPSGATTIDIREHSIGRPRAGCGKMLDSKETQALASDMASTAPSVLTDRSSILAVDPGSASGFAAFVWCGAEGYKLDFYGLMRGTSTLEVARILDRFSDCADRGEGKKRTVVIEDQYIPNVSRRSGKTAGGGIVLSPASIVLLVVNRARWQVSAERLGFETEVVKAQEWQSATLKVGKSARNERKKMAAMVAAGVFAGAKFSQDEADAVCIGLHSVRRRLAHLSTASGKYPTAGWRV